MGSAFNHPFNLCNWHFVKEILNLPGTLKAWCRQRRYVEPVPLKAVL